MNASLSNTPITALRGVGPSVAKKLEKCGIYNLQDLLFHLPFRYQDRTHLTPLRDLRVGDYAVIEAQVVHSQIKSGKRRQLIVTLREGDQFLELRFFNFNSAQQAQFLPGSQVRCFAEVRHWRHRLMMIHPEYRFVHSDILMPIDETLTPIYPSTEGLTQLKWRQLTNQALNYLEQNADIQDYFPPELRDSLQFLDLISALRYLHRPPPDADQSALFEGRHPAQQRLVIEELLAYQLAMHKQRKKIQNFHAPALPSPEAVLKKFLAALPYSLTVAQKRVAHEISIDMQRNFPMLRLVQGDVGSGKTVVAACAALHAIQQGYQVALMAPTELLAEQHFQQFVQWFKPLDIHVSWLSGSLSAKNRRSVLENLLLGITQLIVGTHALFQSDVQFKQLALIIIDEQHRFGVQQRLALQEKGQQANTYPHQLLMTATPIPRTLAMTLYADMDVSLIDELPPGRQPVQTLLLNNQRRAEIITRLKKFCEQGFQAYWVCTLIEESELLESEAAEKTFKNLQLALPECRFALIHGRLSALEKENIMRAFKQGEIQILVATTVIEVGVNVPNACLMVIENAERLGLAQLHQLRGRVGRGTEESYCVLLYQAPLSRQSTERLELLRQTHDGFLIAEKDMAFRGTGEMLGTRQSGLAQFRIANLMRDRILLPQVYDLKDIFLEKYPIETALLIQRWVGSKDKYALS